MNAQLLNPFAHDTPDSVEATLEHASASCARFNPHGQFAGYYLACGRTDGFVTIWDIETKGILRWLEGHVKTVTSVSWSPNNRYLISSSLDWNVVVWDLSRGPGARARTVRFDAPVQSAEFCPGSSKLILVVLETHQAILVDLRRRVRRRVPKRQRAQEPELNGASYPPPLANNAWELEETSPRRWELGGNSDGEEPEAAPGPSRGGQITAARFSPDGNRIFAGTSKGAVLVFDTWTRQLLADVKVSGASSVRELAFDRTGRNLVANSNDRAIRVFGVETRTVSPPTQTEDETDEDSPSSAAAANDTLTQKPRVKVDLNLHHKFQDLVNRTPWNGIGFSGDAEYVMGGAAHKAAHNIYIWDRGAGALVKILEGPREPLVDVDWHPSRPLLASVSTTGTINLWSTPVAEIWSAYAPGFEELEENVEYEEREDEFDLEDEEEVTRRKQDEEEALVDILSLGPSGSGSGFAPTFGFGAFNSFGAGGDTAPLGYAAAAAEAQNGGEGGKGAYPDSPAKVKAKLNGNGNGDARGVQGGDQPEAGLEGEGGGGGEGTSEGESAWEWEWAWEWEKDDDAKWDFCIPARLEDELPEEEMED